MVGQLGECGMQKQKGGRCGSAPCLPPAEKQQGSQNRSDDLSTDKERKEGGAQGGMSAVVLAKRFQSPTSRSSSRLV